VKSAHAGNIANNAYLIAKFLRRKGEDAHAYHFRSEFIMGHPEWEDAAFDGDLDLFDPPDWTTIRFVNGYQRPDWVHYLSGLPDPYVLPATTPGGTAGRIMAATYGDMPVPSHGIGGSLIRLLRQGSGRLAARYAVLARQGQLRTGERLELQVLTQIRLSVEWLATERASRRLLLTDRLRAVLREVDAINRRSRLQASGQKIGPRDLAKAPYWSSYRPLAAAHDLVQLYGLEALKGVFLPPEKPFVAFEHSTMRTLPFDNTVQGRLLAMAYKTADFCVITNPDVVTSATRLGLKHYRFIPHPLDETKYTPGETPLRDEILRQTGSSLIFLCPTRHEWSNAFDSKRSDRVIRAFAAYSHGANPRAALVLSRWGRDLRATEALIDQLGIADRIVWRHPMPKLKLLEHYRAADVVMDQFHEAVGTFGTVTAEALSCAKPVIMYFNPQVHEWCLPEMPPIQSALTEEDIERRLVELAADPDRRQQIGQASREWIIKWHSWERCAGDYLAMYQEILTRRGQASPDSLPVPSTVR
jgi:glycosyltransferase involved in cell wall biosynthesis